MRLDGEKLASIARIPAEVAEETTTPPTATPPADGPAPDAPEAPPEA
jgi:hypothetical protein